MARKAGTVSTESTDAIALQVRARVVSAAPAARMALVPTAGPSPPSPESPRKPFSLTPRQASLREALAAESPEAARMYVGGLMVLADESNPCSLRLASTAMRELIDELAAARGVAGVRGGTVKNRIHNLRESVNRLSGRLRVSKPEPELAARLLDHLDDFFRREDEISPSRRQKMRLVVTAINVGADAPDEVVRPQTERLLKLSAGFGAMLHGGSRAGFEEVLADFESLMLDLLTPDTFEDYATIDELLSKGPPHE